MCIYVYSYTVLRIYVASARADTLSHEVTWQDNYIATLSLLNWSSDNMQHKFSWNK